MKDSNESAAYWLFNGICTIAFILGVLSLIGMGISNIWGAQFWLRVAQSVGLAAAITFAGALILAGVSAKKP